MVGKIELSMPPWLRTFLATQIPRDFSTPESRMEFAIALSEENVKQKTGGPFGAAIFTLDTHELVSCGVNRVEPESLAIAHAEIIAISLAERHLGRFDLGRSDMELVTSSQPCLMCCGATIWAGVRSILIGARREDVESLAGFDEGPLPANWEMEFSRRGISVSVDILRERACAVLEAYRKSGAGVYNSSANLLRPGIFRSAR
jgi:tRNA(Arg) A34 adenosine deaminase TadA